MVRSIRRVALVVAMAAAFGSACTQPVPEPASEPGLELVAAAEQVEAWGVLPVSARFHAPGDGVPSFAWAADSGGVVSWSVANEADYHAPATPGDATITVTVRYQGEEYRAETVVRVVPAGALKPTALVTVEVDAATLTGVWVDAAHPSESFTPPLRIKGTFRYDETTGDAFAGGSWPVFAMRDDGQKGDRVAGDGIWTIAMNFEKSDAKVYFAFDDGSPFRVEWESGLAWRLKTAWIDLDDFPDDMSNPAFVPDGDKIIRWTADMAAAAGIHAAR